jgi:hypothetical protein
MKYNINSKKEGFKLEFDCDTETGSISYCYSGPSQGGGKFNFDGKIPKWVYSGGKKSIEKYLNDRITGINKKIDQDEGKYEKIAKSRIEISTKYKGKTLTGIISKALDTEIFVKLQSPVKGKHSICYGFGSAMAGRFIFDGNGLTDSAIESAKKALCYAYDKAIHKGSIKLADELNKSV